jgi:ornithine cyclodeaminase/alanine dehydrogenase
MNTLLLNQEIIKNIIDMDDVISAVENTFKGLGEGTVVNPAKITLDLGETSEWPPYKGFMNAMPTYVGWLDIAGIKWVGGFMDNAKKNIPYLTGIILLINPATGEFKCIAEGAYITNIRTGAQTAVALKHILGKKEIEVGLYGAGAQGNTQIEAISRIFNIKKLSVYDIRKEASFKLADNVKKFNVNNVKVVDEPELASDAEVIISVTQSKDKFIKKEWIKPGTILFPMGSYQECEDDCILKADKIIVDHIAQALHRGALKSLANQDKLSPEDIYTTIGEIVSGKCKKDILKEDRIICIPAGTGAMDVSVAAIAYKKAKEQQLGTYFDFLV